MSLTKTVMVRVDPEMKSLLLKQAHREQRSEGAIVRIALHRYFYYLSLKGDHK